jgi:signal transduction histidine kinase
MSDIPLARKITLILIGVIGLISLGTGWLSVYDERRLLQEILTRQGNATVRSLAAYSVEAMVSLDYPALEKVMSTVAREAGNIELIEISEGGRVVSHQGDRAMAHGSAFAADIVVQNQGANPKVLGRVDLIVSDRDGDALISTRVRQLIAHALGVFAILAVLLPLLLKRVFLERITNLTRLTESVIRDELPLARQAKLDSRPVRDEIEILHECFTEMLSGLRERDEVRQNTLNDVSKARSLLGDVADSMPSQLLVVSEEGLVVLCNRAALSALMPGEPETAMLGRPLEAVWPLLAGEGETIASALNEHRIASGRMTETGRDEVRHVYQIFIYPLSSTVHKGVLIRIDDVTEQERIEEMMVQTEKMVSVGGLAAGVAHEINNPLGVMVQAAQNIERRVSEALPANHQVAAELGVSVAVIRAYLEKRSILEFLNDIKVDGARAAAVVRSLLDFTRKSEAVWSSVALAELVEASIELARKDYDLRSKFDFRKIALDVSVSPDLAPVTMVRSEIEQVLLNLFKNAAHALADKADSARAQGLEFTPRITIRARKVGAMAYLEVEDNGPGFAPEIRKRVFEPFFTTKPVGVGTGLGLWISYMILTSKHGGQLLLETSPGAGSIFTLILPFKAVVRT